ncbi:type 1 glutamine amidotransferase domain-containing protein [Bernardetia sp. ABR2-2B]|uniref:type 1 glutamine amidotransferase domain-containing protein n=1 Tax=Bernardetia sp. ABR2-2B TaxID=3127472 RepID=UPI0030CDCF37
MTQQEGKILFVVTSHGELGETGKETGYHLSEVSHPWKELYQAGYEMDFVSPKGGKAPVTAFDLSDDINKEFWENDTYREKVENTKKPSEIKPSEYKAIFFAGGHGTVWDFPENKELQNIAATIYESGGIVSSICHGAAALVNLKLSNGSYLIDGKDVNSFTDEEERDQGLEDVVPFLVESKIRQRGAEFHQAAKGEAKVVVDGRLITGQNPASATPLGKALQRELKEVEVA